MQALIDWLLKAHALKRRPSNQLWKSIALRRIAMRLGEPLGFMVLLIAWFQFIVKALRRRVPRWTWLYCHMPIEFAIHIYIPTYHYDITVAVVNEVGRKTAEASAQRQLGSKQSETKCVYGVLALNFSICSERCATSYDFAEASVMRFCTSSRKIFDVSDGSWRQARARCASMFLSGRFLVARVAVTTSFCMRSFVAM